MPVEFGGQKQVGHCFLLETSPVIQPPLFSLCIAHVDEGKEVGEVKTSLVDTQHVTGL